MRTLMLLAGLFLAGPPEEGEYQLLDFSATWCGPCKTLAERIKHDDVKAALKLHKVRVVNIDVDVDKDAVENYKIEMVPTLILVKVNAKKEAKVIKRKTGLQEVKAIVKLVNPEEKD